MPGALVLSSRAPLSRGRTWRRCGSLSALALVMVLGAMVLGAGARARAQCRTRCLGGEGRDPYGCCVPVARTAGRRAREPIEPLVVDDGTPPPVDAAAEAYGAARGWLARARAAEGADRGRGYARRAAGASLVFLALAPDDPRAGRMRAVLVDALDGAGMTDAAEAEAAALGGPRPATEPGDVRTLHADTLLNLAHGHLAIGQRLGGSLNAARRQSAAARHRRAADFYRLYVARFSDLAPAPSARSELANALLGAGEPLAAAVELEALAEAFPARRVEALRRVVDAHRRALAAEVAAGRVSPRSEPPPPSARPPWAPLPELPEPVRRLLDARERYLAAGAAATEPDVAREQDLEVVLTLYRYGRFDAARARIAALLAVSCDDAVARTARAVHVSTSAPNVDDGEPLPDCD